MTGRLTALILLSTVYRIQSADDPRPISLTVVEVDQSQQKSVNVKQTPETASVQSGGTLTLQCSLPSKNKGNTSQCPGEHSVYWFRAESEKFYPSIIYTPKKSSDEQVGKSCVYSLSKTIQSSSDAGTYYCAVVTCGEILFGEGTKVETNLIQSADDPRPICLTVVEVGGNVTLHCPVSEKEGKFFHWYKQSLGYMVQSVAAGTFNRQTFTAQFNNSRFTVTEGQAEYLLTIRNVSKEDEATYLCQSGTPYSQSFVKGTFLAVNDRSQQKSVNVKQTPETASVQSGGTLTLQCSLPSKNKGNTSQCPGEHSVYWFRAESEKFYPSIIYTPKKSSDEQVEKSCVYSLSKTIQSSSDAGTYYCAVVTCGEILFGEGTKVETRPELDSIVAIVLGALLACCVIVIVLLVFHINRIRVCKYCKGMFLKCS
ncbi:uncharacterized protein LOC119888438 [Micropterus salmoides]|uniref:uncharacterized protein LOC119888438 n=1 Tax=Micropterus salmoides TaxID=27706 RepID=UPI0018EC89F3|nr:uncharacterized protein LOC119888438 [Micropterus salmoides]